jgi:hypothetical protein
MSTLFPSSSGNSTCLWYDNGWEVSDKSLEQRVDVKFCVKTGNSVRETSALIT